MMDGSDDPPSTLKDVFLTSLLMLAISGMAYAYRQYQKSQAYLRKMISDIEGLSKAEETLKDLQEQLQRRNSKLQNSGEVTTVQPALDLQNLEVSRLREEVEVLRNELHMAEARLEDRSWTAPSSLQHWLQQTYELELQVYNDKKKSAEQQLDFAKEMCEKLKKKRFSFVGAFVSTHSGSIGDVDRSILEAKTALIDVTQDLTERTQRWRQIEVLCGFSILNSPSTSQSHPRLGSNSRMSNSYSFDESTFDDNLVYEESNQATSQMLRSYPMSPYKHVSRESSKESSSSSSDEIHGGVRVALRRISSSSSFSLSLPPTASQTPTMSSPRKLMPKVGPGGRMMVKSFSQDGYSTMNKKPASLQRGRVVSAATSNEALDDMHTSLSENYLNNEDKEFNGNISNATSSSSMGIDSSRDESFLLMHEDGSTNVTSELSVNDVGSIVSKSKSKMFFNFGSKKDKVKEIL